MAGLEKVKNTPSQEFVPIKDIKEDVLLLEDNTYRAVLMTSSTNFALKSADERSSILYQFQGFLNSLDFTIQIYIQSRRFNIDPYLEVLRKRYNLQENQLMKTQIEEYIDFIQSFTETTNIMKKSFFVVVPYMPLSAALGGGKKLPFFGKSSKGERSEHLFKQHKGQLNQRVSVVEQGLSRSGVRSSRLTGDELVELYHTLFNPDESTTLAE